MRTVRICGSPTDENERLPIDGAGLIVRGLTRPFRDDTTQCLFAVLAFFARLDFFARLTAPVPHPHPRYTRCTPSCPSRRRRPSVTGVGTISGAIRLSYLRPQLVRPRRSSSRGAPHRPRAIHGSNELFAWTTNASAYSSLCRCISIRAKTSNLQRAAP